jgi:predicted enzyme related to lactoylglutathione lyase
MSKPRVTGLGGLFFRSRDPKATLQWYREHLGIDAADWGGFAFQWLTKDAPTQTAYTVWAAFPDDTSYFEPATQEFMMNFRVEGLDALLEACREQGVTVVGGIDSHPNGRFAWILDPEGRKIELWEPVPSKDDPYLNP